MQCQTSYREWKTKELEFPNSATLQCNFPLKKVETSLWTIFQQHLAKGKSKKKCFICPNLRQKEKIPSKRSLLTSGALVGSPL